MLIEQLNKIYLKKKFKKLNIVFLGNPEIGHEVFYLLDRSRKFKISAFFTYKISKKLQMLSKKKKFRLIKVPKYGFKNYFDKLKKFKPDLIFEYGWSEILDERFLNLCPIIGQHPSLLPMRRGRAPVTWAIINGLRYTGVTIFYLDKSVDNGNIIYQKSIKINKKDDSNTLLKKIVISLSKLTLKYVNKFPKNPSIKQDSKVATYTKKRTLLDSEIKLSYSIDLIDKYCRALVEPYYPLPFIRNKYGDIIQLQKVKLIKKNDFFKKK